MSKDKKMESDVPLQEKETSNSTREAIGNETLTDSELNENKTQEPVVEAGTSQTNTEKSDDFQDRYLRLFADFENFRKRTARERIELFASANQELMTALLPVLDDFDRAGKSLPVELENSAFVQGFDLIRDKFKSTLISKGLKSLEIQTGDLFDVDRMEAITKIMAPNNDLKGKVVDVIEQGYRLGDKIIRFARVVIGE